MNKNKIKAVIFDMDGLMFDTDRLTMSLWQKICDEHGGGQCITEEFWASLSGGNSDAFERAFVERFGIDFDYKTKRDQRREMEENHIEANGVPIKDGLHQLLDYLKKNKIKTAVATSRIEKMAQNWLELADVDQYFDVKVFGDSVKHSKPAPDIFLKACEELSVKPEETIVLEDAPNGIIAAHRAGTKPIMIVDYIQPTDEIRKMLFTEPLDSLAEVIEILER
ncbi:HAD family phosphatase [Candidatus Saccharibacteria bacterium]|nr:HAD family phosphatase [Candidatus Saccharibacteria bacterium]